MSFLGSAKSSRLALLVRAVVVSLLLMLPPPSLGSDLHYHSEDKISGAAANNIKAGVVGVGVEDPPAASLLGQVLEEEEEEDHFSGEEEEEQQAVVVVGKGWAVRGKEERSG